MTEGYAASPKRDNGISCSPAKHSIIPQSHTTIDRFGATVTGVLRVIFSAPEHPQHVLLKTERECFTLKIHSTSGLERGSRSCSCWIIIGGIA